MIKDVMTVERYLQLGDYFSKGSKTLRKTLSTINVADVDFDLKLYIEEAKTYVVINCSEMVPTIKLLRLESLIGKKIYLGLVDLKECTYYEDRPRNILQITDVKHDESRKVLRFEGFVTEPTEDIYLEDLLIKNDFPYEYTTYSKFIKEFGEMRTVVLNEFVDKRLNKFTYSRDVNNYK